jgi:hypothetical protein
MLGYNLVVRVLCIYYLIWHNWRRVFENRERDMEKKNLACREMDNSVMKCVLLYFIFSIYFCEKKELIFYFILIFHFSNAYIWLVKLWNSRVYINSWNLRWLDLYTCKHLSFFNWIYIFCAQLWKLISRLIPWVLGFKRVAISL